MVKEILKSRETFHFQELSENNLKFLSNELRIDIKMLRAYPNWYCLDGSFYYFKEMDDLERVINELLGQYLAQYFSLDSVSYMLGAKTENKKIKTGLLSKNVFAKDKKYKNLGDLLSVNVYGIIEKKECLNYFSSLCSNENERKNFILQILRLTILDFYSHQVDRTYPNINIQIKPNIALAPLYDYSESFDSECDWGTANQYTFLCNYDWENKGSYLYQSDLIRLRFPSDELTKIFEEYPEIYSEFLKILDLDLEGYLNQIKEKYDFSIPNYLLKYYMNYDKNKKAFVRTIK